MRSVRDVLAATVTNLALLACAERIQYDGFLLRRGNDRTIEALARVRNGLDLLRARLVIPNTA
jgi:hypothetical protein